MIIGLCVSSPDISEDNTWLGNDLSQELNTSRNHLDIFLSFQIDSELGDDNDIVFTTMCQIKVGSLMSIWFIIDLGVVFVFQGITVDIWRVFEQL